jgi:HK97 family phage prohead protease
MFKFRDGSRQEAMLKFRPANEVELKALGDGLPEGYVAGWASTPDMDHYGHTVKGNTFAKSIVTRGLSGPRGVKLLNQHRSDQPAGVIKVLEYRGDDLWIEAELNMKISYVRDVYEAAKMNGGLSFSVGFSLVKDGYSFKKDASGEEYLEITDGDLFEVSVVTFPANEAAEMVFVKGIDSETFNTVAEFEKALVATGVAKSRNHAHEFTLVVKRNLHLFRDETPVLASAKTLDDLTVTLAKLRDVLSTN